MRVHATAPPAPPAPPAPRRIHIRLRLRQPVLNAMHDEQEREGTVWAPSTMIARFGREIGHESSVLYWAAKNAIPVFSPAITDGSVRRRAR